MVLDHFRYQAIHGPPASSQQVQNLGTPCFRRQSTFDRLYLTTYAAYAGKQFCLFSCRVGQMNTFKYRVRGYIIIERERRSMGP